MSPAFAVALIEMLEDSGDGNDVALTENKTTRLQFYLSFSHTSIVHTMCIQGLEILSFGHITAHVNEDVSEQVTRRSRCQQIT